MIEEIKNDINGLDALHDWLGDQGEPVSQIIAEYRSRRCVACPMNREPGWWDRVKTAIAMWIRKELEIKNNMHLRVSAEASLNMCAACGCCLPLKVWVPPVHVISHTTKKQLAKMPDFCWIRKELEHQSPQSFE